MNSRPEEEKKPNAINSLDEIRSQIVDRILLYYAYAVPLTWVTAFMRSLSVGWQPIFTLQLIISVPFFVVAVFRKRIGFQVRVTSLLIPLYLLGIVGTYSLGLSGSGLLILFAASVFTAIFFGIKAGVATSIFNVLIVAAFGVAFASETITLDFDIGEHAVSGVAWTTKAVVFLLFAPMVVIALAVVQGHLASSLDRLKESYALLVSRQEELTEAYRIARMGRWERDLIHNRLTWSEEVYSLFGKDQNAFVVGHNSFLECVHPDDVEKVRRTYDDAIVDHLPFELVFRAEVGKELIFISQKGQTISDNKGNAVRMVGTVQDITERMKIEAQLQSRQKMEAIGQLAGGIAHDFNNIISGIMGACDLLQQRISPDADAKNTLNIICQSGEKAASLTDKLLTFARQSPQSDEVVDLHLTIKDSIVLLKGSMGGGISLDVSLNAKNSCVIGDAALLQSVLLNLGINAAHAMPHGGTLSIKTSNIQFDERFCRSSPVTLSPGDYLQLEVSDTGTGIPLDVQPHIFEPFYTTKEKSKGTGLGLATAYGTIKQHGGSIEVKSIPEEGACFKILLPLPNLSGPHLSLSPKS